MCKCVCVCVSVCVCVYTCVVSVMIDIHIQIIEPHIGESGDVIANIPIRISARAVYSL